MRDARKDEPRAKPAFADSIGDKARRKLAARRRGSAGVWFGLGMMGLVGWSVVVPTLVGAALGMWLDKHHSGGHAWTLPLLIAGLVLGCANAWHWVSREERAIHQKGKDDDA